jgi:hypothetical protein
MISYSSICICVDFYSLYGLLCIHRSSSSSRSTSRSKSPSTSSTSSDHKHRRKHKRHDSSESDTAYDPDKPFWLERWPVSPGPGLKLITRHWDPESSSDSEDDLPPPPPPPIEDCPDVQLVRRNSASSPPVCICVHIVMCFR